MDDIPAAVRRDPAGAAGRDFDLIVVGGGIYGAFMALEATGAGLRTLLLERGDFGGGASGSSLRIAHGGLRYLQSLDLERFRRSVREREWLRATFPHLVQAMGCLMPLYGRGLKRPGILRVALRANDFGVRHYARIPGAGSWPRGRVLDPRMTRELYPSVPGGELEGAAFWYDGRIRSAPRLLMEVLRWSCGMGAEALNYLEVLEVQVRGGKVRGVLGRDRLGGRDLTFRAPLVVNAAGESVARLAATAGLAAPDLFHPTLAFNVLLRRAPLCGEALAVTPPDGSAPTSFMVPLNGRILAGTWHGAAPTPDPGARSGSVTLPRETDIADFLDRLNRAAPALNARREDVVRIFPGLLPGGSDGAILPRRHPIVIEHGARGEAAGLFSVSGVKYTTARYVAAQTVRRIHPGRLGSRIRRITRSSDVERARLEARTAPILLDTPEALLARDPSEVSEVLRHLVQGEAVLHLDDLLLRRTDWGIDPEEGREVARFIAPLLRDLPEWRRLDAVRESREIDGAWVDSQRDAMSASGTGPAA